MLGTTELIVIGLVIFVLFGASAIPKFAKSLGQAKNEFDKGFKTGSGTDKKESGDSKEV
jgi:sec-independent protein translocase protein TatA